MSLKRCNNLEQSANQVNISLTEFLCWIAVVFVMIKTPNYISDQQEDCADNKQQVRRCNGMCEVMIKQQKLCNWSCIITA